MMVLFVTLNLLIDNMKLYFQDTNQFALITVVSLAVLSEGLSRLFPTIYFTRLERNRASRKNPS